MIGNELALHWKFPSPPTKLFHTFQIQGFQEMLRVSLMHTADLPSSPQEFTALPHKGLGERICGEIGKKNKLAP